MMTVFVWTAETLNSDAAILSTKRADRINVCLSREEGGALFRLAYAYISSFLWLGGSDGYSHTESESEP
jgi:hypothetical protein